MSEAKTTLKIEDSGGTTLELELLGGYGYLRLKEEGKEQLSLSLDDNSARVIGDFLLNKWFGAIQ